MDNIEQIFKKLPRDLQEEALDFIKFLIEKHQKKKLKENLRLSGQVLSKIYAINYTLYLKYIVESSQKFKLDFDDAYQYSTSEKISRTTQYFSLL